MTEKEIKGFENYMVRIDGSIRSIERSVVTYGTRRFVKKSRILKQKLNRYGRYEVCLLDSSAKKCFIQVSRIVANAFVPNADNKPQVNHINGIKTDNRVENLEWVTRSENMAHAVANALMMSGANHSQYKHGLNIINRRGYVLAWHRANWRGFDWKKLSTEEKLSFFKQPV